MKQQYKKQHQGNDRGQKGQRQGQRQGQRRGQRQGQRQGQCHEQCCISSEPSGNACHGRSHRSNGNSSRTDGPTEKFQYTLAKAADAPMMLLQGHDTQCKASTRMNNLFDTILGSYRSGDKVRFRLSATIHHGWAEYLHCC